MRLNKYAGMDHMSNRYECFVSSILKEFIKIFVVLLCNNPQLAGVNVHAVGE